MPPGFEWHRYGVGDAANLGDLVAVEGYVVDSYTTEQEAIATAQAFVRPAVEAGASEQQKCLMESIEGLRKQLELAESLHEGAERRLQRVEEEGRRLMGVWCDISQGVVGDLRHLLAVARGEKT